MEEFVLSSGRNRERTNQLNLSSDEWREYWVVLVLNGLVLPAAYQVSPQRRTLFPVRRHEGDKY